MSSASVRLAVGEAGFAERPDAHAPGRRWSWRPGRALSAQRIESLAATVVERQRRLTVVDDDLLVSRAQAAALARRRGRGNDRRDHGGAEAELFACLCEASRRTLGVEPFAEQLAAASALLEGRLIEMATGEGKTLAIALAAAAKALLGVPVHVITANDYLARRDADWMAPFYRSLGLGTGVVVAAEPEARRRQAYRSDVVYCASKELVFDFLRDRQLLGGRRGLLALQFDKLYGRHSRSDRLLLPGLRFAIVDEADSVLIDETRTPLILSRPGRDGQHGAMAVESIAIARSLDPGDYVLEPVRRHAALTETGRQRVLELARSLGPAWKLGPLRESAVTQALAALHLYRRDHDYVVRDGRVLIVDEHTGRTMPGRSWSRGLHGFVEAKEACEITPEPETLARVSYQRFFRRYLELAGTTGTAMEVARELQAVYGTRVVTVPAHRRCRRRRLPDRVFATFESKWQHVVARIREVHATGQPVLIGTSSVAASQILSDRLTAAGLEHRTLNALQDRDEAETVALAGQRGRITVATNMAGRGTDIRLGDGVAALGGLHVIVTERHAAARIDRQLIGRCARQGDPGSAEMILSLEDSIVAACGSPLLQGAARLLGHWPALAASCGGLVLRAAQRRIERLQSRSRRELVFSDSRQDSRLAFSGRPD